MPAMKTFFFLEGPSVLTDRWLGTPRGRLWKILLWHVAFGTIHTDIT